MAAQALSGLRFLVLLRKNESEKLEFDGL